MFSVTTAVLEDIIKAELKASIQRDEKIWTQFVGLYGLNSKRRLNTRQTLGCGIPSSLLALRVDLAWATLKTLLNSSHVFL